MSISKEIFGINYKANGYVEALDCKQSKNTFAHRWPQEMIDGYNQALDEIDQFELSEVELCKLIDYHATALPSTIISIAKAIKQNQSKIFVRKT